MCIANGLVPLLLSIYYESSLSFPNKEKCDRIRSDMAPVPESSGVLYKITHFDFLFDLSMT